MASELSVFERVFGAFGLSDLVDVVIVSAVIYSLLVWFKRSRRPSLSLEC